jgi:HTH-type transcriptional regulator / antitoxin HigA
MTKTKANPIFENGIPDTFEKLCSEYPPRPIHDSESHDDAVEIIDALSGLKLNDDQEDYLEVIGTLINQYEENNLDILPSASPREVLAFLLDQNNITGRELGRILGKDESLGAKILSGERSITIEHAVALAKRFAVKPEIFLNLRIS